MSKLPTAEFNEGWEEGRHSADVELMQLRAENERLRAAWHWAAPHLAAYAVHYPNQDYIAAFEHHRRALEGK